MPISKKDLLETFHKVAKALPDAQPDTLIDAWLHNLPDEEEKQTISIKSRPLNSDEFLAAAEKITEQWDEWDKPITREEIVRWASKELYTNAKWQWEDFIKHFKGRRITCDK